MSEPEPSRLHMSTSMGMGGGLPPLSLPPLSLPPMKTDHLGLSPLGMSFSSYTPSLHSPSIPSPSNHMNSPQTPVMMAQPPGSPMGYSNGTPRQANAKRRVNPNERMVFQHPFHPQDRPVENQLMEPPMKQMKSVPGSPNVLSGPSTPSPLPMRFSMDNSPSSSLSHSPLAMSNQPSTSQMPNGNGYPPSFHPNNHMVPHQQGHPLPMPHPVQHHSTIQPYSMQNNRPPDYPDQPGPSNILPSNGILAPDMPGPSNMYNRTQMSPAEQQQPQSMSMYPVRPPQNYQPSPILMPGGPHPLHQLPQQMAQQSSPLSHVPPSPVALSVPQSPVSMQHSPAPLQSLAAMQPVPQRQDSFPLLQRTEQLPVVGQQRQDQAQQIPPPLVTPKVEGQSQPPQRTEAPEPFQHRIEQVPIKEERMEQQPSALQGPQQIRPPTLPVQQAQARVELPPPPPTAPPLPIPSEQQHAAVPVEPSLQQAQIHQRVPQAAMQQQQARPAIPTPNQPLMRSPQRVTLEQRLQQSPVQMNGTPQPRPIVRPGETAQQALARMRPEELKLLRQKQEFHRKMMEHKMRRAAAAQQGATPPTTSPVPPPGHPLGLQQRLQSPAHQALLQQRIAQLQSQATAAGSPRPAIPGQASGPTAASPQKSQHDEKKSESPQLSQVQVRQILTDRMRGQQGPPLPGASLQQVLTARSLHPHRMIHPGQLLPSQLHPSQANLPVRSVLQAHQQQLVAAGRPGIGPVIVNPQIGHPGLTQIVVGPPRREQTMSIQMAKLIDERLPQPSASNKEQYRLYKKKFKYLVFENECYQEELRNLQRKLLKLTKDKNFLLDRLLNYEKLSDESEEDSDSSQKTVDERPKAKKRVRSNRAKKDSSAAITPRSTSGTPSPCPSPAQTTLLAQMLQPCSSGLGKQQFEKMEPEAVSFEQKPFVGFSTERTIKEEPDVAHRASPATPPEMMAGPSSAMQPPLTSSPHPGSDSDLNGYPYNYSSPTVPGSPSHLNGMLPASPGPSSSYSYKPDPSSEYRPV